MLYIEKGPQNTSMQNVQYIAKYSVKPSDDPGKGGSI
jgi:hypothetical protein